MLTKARRVDIIPLCSVGCGMISVERSNADSVAPSDRNT